MAERRSPLAGVADRLAKVTGPIEMAEVPFLTQLNVRRDPNGPVGFPFPTQPCTSVRSGDVDVLWLGPDEWLVLGATETDFPDAAAAIDVSANRVAFELAGHDAADVLATGCALDLDRFEPGRCAQTLLARAQVILHRPDAETFRILVRPSFAPYLSAWLGDAVAAR
jgi:sarcosine oxidase subunit gamma